MKQFLNIEIYKLVTCWKWSGMIGQIHLSSWQYKIFKKKHFLIKYEIYKLTEQVASSSPGSVG